MKTVKFRDWIEDRHPRYVSLSDSVALIATRLLNEANIPYLAVTKRTKSVSDCLSKSKRKRYKNPEVQMTDISGVRIIVYFDYDVAAVSSLIEENFQVDRENSSNRDSILSVNEVGYRSVHYVCDLGPDRENLREYQSLSGLKFEFQVRTVLQHAWAELAHDRNYKFSGQLPKEIERKLFLLAGLMETADNGFSGLSREIDEYRASISEVAENGELESVDLNALSIEEFVRNWCAKNGIQLEEVRDRDLYNDLLRELKQFGVNSLEDLRKIIPPMFIERFEAESTTILGIVRDWMIITDPSRFLRDVKIDWLLPAGDVEKFGKFLSEEEIAMLQEEIGIDVGDGSPWDDLEDEVLSNL